MCNLFRRWHELHRYRLTARDLNSLSLRELQALWITPAEIDRLAWTASHN
jgi:hypothetical protein